MSKAIKNWNEDERPREKLQQKGPTALSNAELLAILIGSGSENFSALDAARHILQLAKNSMSTLGKLSVKELQQVKGIGPVRAITIAAALELGRRRQINDEDPKLKLNTSLRLANIIRPYLQDLNYEATMVLYLNNHLQLLHQEVLSQGGLTSTIMDHRIILKNALLQGATKIALAHNHPSGNVAPSKQDLDHTKRIVEAGRLMEINLIEHIIIAGHEYFSFKDNNLL